jgi:tRNA threonylcarbamoyladenosine biosynthesis protein TsaB
VITFALDTATAGPSVALIRDEAVLAENVLQAEAGSGRRVMEAAHDLLSRASVPVGTLDRIVVGVGPGGFTGLRIGIATALGLGQALRIAVDGVVSLEALALGIAEASAGAQIVVPVLDARRRELFAAAYRPGPDGRLDEVIGPTALEPGDLADRLAGLGGGVVVGGPGLAVACEALERVGVTTLPEGSPGHVLCASRLAVRAAAGGVRPVRPVYVRLPDAEVNRRAAAAR